MIFSDIDDLGGMAGGSLRSSRQHDAPWRTQRMSLAYGHSWRSQYLKPGMMRLAVGYQAGGVAASWSLLIVIFDCHRSVDAHRWALMVGAMVVGAGPAGERRV